MERICLARRMEESTRKHEAKRKGTGEKNRRASATGRGTYRKSCGLEKIQDGRFTIMKARHILLFKK